MTEEDWLRHLVDNPYQAEPALRFADWLEENGKPAHAEIIRLHHKPADESQSRTWPGGYHYTTISELNPKKPLLSLGHYLRKYNIYHVQRQFLSPYKNLWIAFGRNIKSKKIAKQLFEAIKEELPPDSHTKDVTD